jgi:hypothetical protein
MTGKAKPRKPIPEFDLNAFSGSFRAESDRACAVLGAALLDARLESLYSRRLRTLKDELLGFSGVLGAFSARIRVARALEWISEDVYFDLEQIRKIRNEFAHNFDHELSFSNEFISRKCLDLRVTKELIAVNEYIASTLEKQALDPENSESILRSNYSAATIRGMGAVFHPPRARFEISIEILAQHLDELPEDKSEYEGTNLKEELRKLEYQMCGVK